MLYAVMCAAAVCTAAAARICSLALTVLSVLSFACMHTRAAGAADAAARSSLCLRHLCFHVG